MTDMYPVFLGGKQIGKVTSACAAPGGKHRLRDAVGRAPSRSARSSRSRPHRGVTVRKPFIDPDKEIPKR
jgi:hypothetical protein